MIAFFFPAFQTLGIKMSAQSALESKINTTRGKTVEFGEKESSGRQRGQFGFKGGKPFGNKVCIYKMNNSIFLY